MPETLFVLTNATKQFGASCILYPNVLKNFCKEKNMDAYDIDKLRKGKCKVYNGKVL